MKKLLLLTFAMILIGCDRPTTTTTTRPVPQSRLEVIEKLEIEDIGFKSTEIIIIRDRISRREFLVIPPFNQCF